MQKSQWSDDSGNVENIVPRNTAGHSALVEDQPSTSGVRVDTRIARLSAENLNGKASS